MKIIQQEDGSSQLIAEYEQKECKVTIPFADQASVSNALSCWLVSLKIGLKHKEIEHKFASLPAVAMRLEMNEAINNCFIINDAYNSDIESLSIAMDSMNQHKQFHKRVLILSDFVETGKNSEQLYARVASMLKQHGIDRFFGVGDQLITCKSKFPENSTFFRSTEEFLDKVGSASFSNELILLKGARRFGFERIAKFLQKKKHQTVLEIDFNALVHNLNYFKGLLKPETRLMVMVKAFSYGSGIVEVSNLLAHQRVDYLAVAFPDEGIELRKAGIGLPIMVLSADWDAMAGMIENRLEPVVYSTEQLLHFAEMVKVYGIKSYPVHIEIDTGMHRLGFLEEEIDELLQIKSQFTSLKIQSVFSHLVGSDEENHDDFSIQQTRIFNRCCKKIEKSLNYKFIRHILNSAGIERFPDFQMDMVRLGIGLYGLSRLGPENVKNISTLKTVITQIKSVKRRKTVGYNRNGKAESDKVIAIIPVGYADGFPRKLSNGNGKVCVNGKIASVIGNVCMDMTMIDVTGLNVDKGDEVIIFGDELPITVMADSLDTIPYEILTNVSRRVKRNYLYE